LKFTLIKGSFKPKTGQPDGDSVRFQADDPTLWDRIPGHPNKIGSSVQLRFEGIDALEKRAITPLSTLAKESMLNLIGFHETGRPTPPGYILTNKFVSKRPVCFVFAGYSHRKDGAQVSLDATMLRDSVNYRQAQTGYAYPLFYNTLDAQTRTALAEVIGIVAQRPLGNWPTDATHVGVTVRTSADLATIPPIWPKLWRRLETFLKKNRPLTEFVPFLAGLNERMRLVSSGKERGFAEIVAVQGDQVRMTESPAELIITSSG